MVENDNRTERAVSSGKGILIGLMEHPKAGSFFRNLYRCTFPRKFKHMAVTGPGFDLRERDDGGRDILWRHREVGRTRPLSELRDQFSGDCFVLGTGPSIQKLDLTRLRGRRLIGVNGAVAKFAEMGIQADAYVVTDWDFFENRFDMVRDMMAGGARCFFSYSGLSRICRREPESLKGAAIYLTEVVNRRFGVPRMPLDAFKEWAEADPDIELPREPRSDDCRVGFSRNMEKGVFSGRTITFRALQVAYYLGFKRQYVLGMDLNYRGPNPRFYESADKMRPSKIDKDYEPVILPAFEVLQRLIANGELSVYNLSPTSRLPAEVMPGTTFEAALRGQP